MTYLSTMNPSPFVTDLAVLLASARVPAVRDALQRVWDDYCGADTCDCAACACEAADGDPSLSELRDRMWAKHVECRPELWT